jgi:hypothetical protein
VAQIAGTTESDHNTASTLVIDGFDNILAQKADSPCQDALVTGRIQVQKPFVRPDDFTEVATQLENHPVVKKYFQPFVESFPGKSIEELTSQSWHELASSCAFLPTQKVYLCVSRLIFHPGNALDKVFASFLRGRIFDENWVHQPGYVLSWPRTKQLSFPTIFEVGMQWKRGGLAYGPEDPRIVIEDVPDAEPVIVFSMLVPVSESKEWKRVMHNFRPFTNVTTVLTIRGTERSRREKNWSPFFLSTNSRKLSSVIHFVWRHAPLTILKCHMEDGMCDIVYEQEMAPKLAAKVVQGVANLRGGTQLIPIPRKSADSGAVQAFIAVPRHHVSPKPLPECDKPAYRPELAVLVTNTTHFYFAYISAPIDFGSDMVLSASQLADSCGTGRIIIATSIARWEFGVPLRSENKAYKSKALTDSMTLTLTVNDDSVQYVRLFGVYKLLQNLPSLSAYFSRLQASDLRVPDAYGVEGKDMSFSQVSAAGWSARACVEEAAEEYTRKHLKKVSKAI